MADGEPPWRECRGVNVVTEGLRSANGESHPFPTPGGGGSGGEVRVVSFQTDFYSDILFGFGF